MCRWLAYTGAPILLTDVLYTPVHSLIDQSLHSKLGAETTNGDGFGVGWYDAAPVPEVFRSIESAWNDQNLRELAGHIDTTDGETIWAFRYSTVGKSRSLFFTRDVRTLREQYPDREILREVSDDARLVVSEPIGDLPGAWEEMPEATCAVIRMGEDRLLPFHPEPPDGR